MDIPQAAPFIEIILGTLRTSPLFILQCPKKDTLNKTETNLTQPKGRLTFFFVVGPLRVKGVKPPGPLSKKKFFSSSNEKISEKI